MSSPPEYFERIREDASKRWDQLEQDPDLAGPWHQLFKQVQSPRHILSELLQNADDAGATSTSVQIKNGVFIFRHNGEDFTSEHFLSLCSFGYSNKRALHTIGFRGIGFKSIFSLGDRVELYTPTLSIAFESHRFTEPMWLDAPLRNDGLTEVRVEIRDEHRQLEVEKNLQDWYNSPVSLLFFKNIRHINIQDNEVQWRIIGPGPVKDTEWVELVSKTEKSYLIARSAFEQFPSDALTEIKQEHTLGMGEYTEFPPCQVEIVLGANGRLFVVLPTGVKTSLPFACNAPFIQDPDRSKIKSLATSPTNRWLLKRIGRLAASVMLQWLGQNTISIAERSNAYALLPEIESDDSSLEGICATTVIENFERFTENQNCLLTSEGDLKPANQSVIIPNEIIEIWPAKQAVSFLDDLNRPALSHHISKTNRSKLLRREVIEEITKDQVLDTLRRKHLPKPENWYQLLNLWAYIASEFTGYGYNYKNYIHIVPVQGKDVLYAAKEVVRIGKKKMLQSDEDWHFLSKYLLVLDNEWIRFLSNQQQGVEDNKEEVVKKKLESAYDVLEAIGLGGSSTVTRVIEQVAAEFFGQDEITIPDCAQLTQIAAKLGATIRDSFQYVTEDKCLRSVADIILFDDDGTLEQILPPDWSSNHLLHSDYSKEFKSCTRDDWIGWINSGDTGLFTFVPIEQKTEYVRGHEKIVREMHVRGFKGKPSFQYKTNTFVIADWDFDEEHWDYWNSLAKENNKIWVQIAKCIFSQNASFWSKTKNARVLHKSQQNTRKQITSDRLLPAWILKLRELPCLPDTRGFYRKPAEIFRRTIETESLVDVEPFIYFRYDNESTRVLLSLLGVCDTPTGPDRLLDRLRALSKADNPPMYEVDKWYQRLDQMLYNCSTEDFAKIKHVFTDEKIILTESGNWSKLSGVFLFSDEEDVPGAEIIRSSVKELKIWRQIGVNERPTADLVIKWLKELPTGQMLSKDDLPRVRKILPRHAFRIWNECRHWLNLVGEWTPVEDIEYSITMQSLIKWSHLHERVKQKTADFRNLTGELLQVSPFSEFSTLANQIDNCFRQDPSFIGSLGKKEWLNRFGEDICRIVLDDEDNTSRIRLLAADLSETVWQKTLGLETIPYIDGTPAGTSTNVDVIWLDKILYFDDIPNAKLARQ
ncbi:MAG: ATPase, partial [Thermodesulfobacteriota bacterium]|nr:ATPase [Thermodesulfobacteriota bacterium]